MRRVFAIVFLLLAMAAGWLAFGSRQSSTWLDVVFVSAVVVFLVLLVSEMMHHLHRVARSDDRHSSKYEDQSSSSS